MIELEPKSCAYCGEKSDGHCSSCYAELCKGCFKMHESVCEDECSQEKL